MKGGSWQKSKNGRKGLIGRENLRSLSLIVSLTVTQLNKNSGCPCVLRVGVKSQTADSDRFQIPNISYTSS